MPAPRDRQINKDFKGLVTNMGPTDRPPGAAVKQVNLTLSTRGTLKTRGGLRPAKWEN